MLKALHALSRLDLLPSFEVSTARVLTDVETDALSMICLVCGQARELGFSSGSV